MSHVVAGLERLYRHDDGVHDARPHGEPDQGDVGLRASRRIPEEQAQRRVQADDHHEVVGLIRRAVMPCPPRRPHHGQRIEKQHHRAEENQRDLKKPVAGRRCQCVLQKVCGPTGPALAPASRGPLGYLLAQPIAGHHHAICGQRALQSCCCCMDATHVELFLYAAWICRTAPGRYPRTRVCGVSLTPLKNQDFAAAFFAGAFFAGAFFAGVLFAGAFLAAVFFAGALSPPDRALTLASNLASRSETSSVSSSSFGCSSVVNASPPSSLACTSSCSCSW